MIVDARGLRCPWPALRLARAMRAGDAATILTDDPLAQREIAALAAAQAWTVSPVEEGGFRVERAAR
jgi:tRNA 2-thiouridine synthesizing protein A